MRKSNCFLLYLAGNVLLLLFLFAHAFYQGSTPGQFLRQTANWSPDSN